MPITLHEIMELAERLHAMEQSEVVSRSAVSRAYYAALHATKGTFPARQRVDGESSHAEIIGRAKAYGNSIEPGRSEANRIAMWMPRLRSGRNLADYDLEMDLSPKDAAGHLERARLILGMCDDIVRKRSDPQALAQG
jgi:uncharacterized protein (UPF0332 family)